MISQYRNFFIRYNTSEHSMCASIHLDEADTAVLAVFSSSTKSQLEKHVRTWIDGTLKLNRHYVRENRKKRKTRQLTALEAWLS